MRRRVSRPADRVDLNLRQPEARAPARDHDVAERGHQHPEADRRAVDGDDDRHGHVEQRGLRIAHPHQVVAGREVQRLRAGDARIVEVEATAEDAGQAAAPDDRAHLGIIAEAVQLLGHRLEHDEAERVHGRPGDGERGDAALALDAQRLVHLEVLPPSGRRWRVGASGRWNSRRMPSALANGRRLGAMPNPIPLGCSPDAYFRARSTVSWSSSVALFASLGLGRACQPTPGAGHRTPLRGVPIQKLLNITA